MLRQQQLPLIPRQLGNLDGRQVLDHSIRRGGDNPARTATHDISFDPTDRILAWRTALITGAVVVVIDIRTRRSTRDFNAFEPSLTFTKIGGHIAGVVSGIQGRND